MAPMMRIASKSTVTTDNVCVSVTPVPYDPAMLDFLDQALAPAGLFVRGGFHPGPDEGIPPLADGGTARTVLLIGNAGRAMWDAFLRSRPDGGRHPLDRWLRPRIEDVAARAGATALFPGDGPPFVPMDDWAMRGDAVHRSPLGILIHPDFGLWHVYRAVLLFAETLDLPPRDPRGSPCETCTRRPCLSVCPADAFRPDRFLAAACADHVGSDAGRACRDGGCLARKACPVGRDYAYPRDQQGFHMAAMLDAMREGFGREP